MRHLTGVMESKFQWRMNIREKKNLKWKGHRIEMSIFRNGQNI